MLWIYINPQEVITVDTTIYFIKDILCYAFMLEFGHVYVIHGMQTALFMLCQILYQIWHPKL